MTIATGALADATIREIEGALRLPCEFDECLGQHRAPATWEIELRHGTATCDVERLVICSLCRDGLHRYRHQQIVCPTHGALGYSVADWWRPLGVI